MIFILLAIIGVIISMAVGMVWYSLGTPMGKIQMEAINPKVSMEEHRRKMDEMKPVMWKYMLAQAFLALLTSLFIAFIMIEQKGFGSGPIYGEVAFIWLAFTVPMVGQSILWGNCPKELRWKKFFSDAFSNLVTYLLIVLAFSFIV